MAEVERFIAVNTRFASGITSDEDMEYAVSILKSIDFTLFTLDEMEAVENATWIPTEELVQILRSWLSAQQDNLNRIRSYLTVTSTVAPSLLAQFVDAVFLPSSQLSLDIENVIQLLGTAGGSREYQNPIDLGLVTAESECELSIKTFSLRNMFSGDPSCFFRSSPKQNPSFVIGLPPFLQIAVTSYSFKAPPKPEGMKSWTLQGSIDKVNWVGLANEVNNPGLAVPGDIGVFPLEEKSAALRWFKVTQKDVNHAKTLSIVLSGFDLSGEVKLVPN